MAVPLAAHVVATFSALTNSILEVAETEPLDPSTVVELEHQGVLDPDLLFAELLKDLTNARGGGAP